MAEEKTELEARLAREVGEGFTESGGRFSLDPAKALEKLGQFQFDDPSDWILKVVQAAVAGQADRLDIFAGGDSATIQFTPRCSTLEIEFADLLNTECTPDRPDWIHLRRALWSLVGQGLDFQCRNPYGPGWDHRQGQLRADGLPAQAQFILNVKCPTETLVRKLTRRAFLCPIPLLVNHKVISSLLRCPRHGVSANSSPIVIRFFQNQGLPTLPLPLHTVQYEPSSPTLLEELPTTEQSEGLELAVLLSIHWVQRRGKWTTLPSESCLYWVADGVIVETQTLPGTGKAISCGVYLSAEGLETDLSGFRTVRSDARKERQLAAFRAVRNVLAELDLPREKILSKIGNTHAQAMLKGCAVGGLVCLASPPLGGLILFGSVVIPLCFSFSASGVLGELQLAFESLRIQMGQDEPPARGLGVGTSGRSPVARSD